MITNDGKEIIAKFLLGYVPEYATHMSIGCGAVPLDANDPLPNDMSAKQRMDFEMTRVPISSKGFIDASEFYSVTNLELTSNVVTLTLSVTHDIVAGETIVVSNVDDAVDGQYRVSSVGSTTVSYEVVHTDIASVGVTGDLTVSRTKMALTAELPADNRYDVTEIGIWSAGSNSLVSQYDSRMIFNFSDGWQIHDVAISDPPLNNNLGYDGSTTTVDIYNTTDTAFYASTSDPIFQVTTRKNRYEGPRHLNRTLMVRGDFSNIDDSAGIDGDWTATGSHIHLNNIGFDISGNNTSDLLKLAFSMIDRNAVGDPAVQNVKILMEFFKNEVNDTSGYAKAQIYVPGSVIDANRYFVGSMQISQSVDHSNEAASTSLPYIRFYSSSDFAAAEIKICRMFVTVVDSGGDPSVDHFLALDGFRIDNTTENPTYKMSGYSIVRNDGYPITKPANTNNYFDFRFALGI